MSTATASSTSSPAASGIRGRTSRSSTSLGDVQRVDDYYDDFSTIPLDINGDGRLDFVTGGWWGNTLRWRENPGGDVPELADPCHRRSRQCRDDARLGCRRRRATGDRPQHARRAAGRLQTDTRRGRQGNRRVLAPRDLRASRRGTAWAGATSTADGRGDFILNKGWLECPADPLGGEWILHPEFDLGWDASIPILVVDVNGDGLNDLIVGGSHSYGLYWWEQGRDADGGRTWTKHPIDPFNSEYHDLHWADIDGDGQNELVTGKRYQAHPNDGDPGGWDDIGIYYFKWNGEGVQQAGDLLRPARRRRGLRHPLRPRRPARHGPPGHRRARQRRPACLLQRRELTP